MSRVHLQFHWSNSCDSEVFHQKPRVPKDDDFAAEEEEEEEEWED